MAMAPSIPAPNVTAEAYSSGCARPHRSFQTRDSPSPRARSASDDGVGGGSTLRGAMAPAGGSCAYAAAPAAIVIAKVRSAVIDLRRSMLGLSFRLLGGCGARPGVRALRER